MNIPIKQFHFSKIIKSLWLNPYIQKKKMQMPLWLSQAKAAPPPAVLSPNAYAKHHASTAWKCLGGRRRAGGGERRRRWRRRRWRGRRGDWWDEKEVEEEEEEETRRGERWGGTEYYSCFGSCFLSSSFIILPHFITRLDGWKVKSISPEQILCKWATSFGLLRSSKLMNE